MPGSARTIRLGSGARVAVSLIELAARIVPKRRCLCVVYGLTASDPGARAVEQGLVSRGLSPVRLTDSPRLPPSGSVRHRRKRSARGIWAYLRAAHVFTTHELFGGARSHGGQQSVLLWHGEVVKPVALLDGGLGVGADVAPVCSNVGRAFRCAEFGLVPSQVPVVGAPRNDLLLTADRDGVRSRLSWPSTQTTWMWLPTYRTAVRGTVRTDAEGPANGLPFGDDALRRLDRLLAVRGVTVVMKPHPLSEQNLPGDLRNIRLLTTSELDRRGVTLYEALGVADGLVTDVSSVWIDYLLTQRPIVFAFPDLHAYRQRRGLNLEPYEGWVPGPLVDDVACLAAHLTDHDQQAAYASARLEALRRFHRFTDAASTSRLLDLLRIGEP